jgi:hypothetical protein
MWDDRFAEICSKHPDLVAVYESARGRLGLLLRQTLVPLDAERMQWLDETRQVARPLIADLRASGFTGGTVVLQWVPIRDVARIVGRWIRRWDGDPLRRSQLLAVVERHLIDERFLAGRTRPRAQSTTPTPVAEHLADLVSDDPPAESEVALDETGLDALKAWYAAMAPCWLAIQPARRRRLVLQTHVWLADLALSDPIDGPDQAIMQLGPEGSLARALRRLVSRREAPAWRRWIDAVRTDLASALTRPPAHRTQAWARGLFFIPYRTVYPHEARPRSAWTAPARGAKMEA